MAWPGYYEFNGVEIINVARTEAYADGTPWFKPAYRNEDLAPLLGDHYDSPLQDDAPWTDPDNLDTYDFWGVYPLDVAGIEDATTSATVTESTLDGGLVGRGRLSTRAVVFNTVLLGRSDCAVLAGLDWLKAALGSGPCSGPAEASCAGANLCFLSCEPCIDWDTCGPQTTPTVAASEGGPRLVAPAGLPYNDEMYQVGNTGALDPVITGGGSLEDASDASYVKVQHTATSSSYAGVAMDGFTLPTDAVVTSVVVNMRARGNSNHSTPTSSYILHADIGESGKTYASPGKIYGNRFGAVTAGQIPMNDTYVNLTYTIDQADVTFNAVSGISTVRHLAEIIAAGSVIHFWVSTPSGFISYADVAEYSLTVNYTVPAVVEPLPAVTVAECLDRVMRSMHKMAITNGPSVTGKRTMIDGGVAWMVTWTMVAGNPFTYGSEKRMVRGFMNPQVDVPYPVGIYTDTGDVPSFDDVGTVQTEFDCPVRTYAPLEDPNCPQTILPPGAPQNGAIQLSCFNFPANFNRRVFTIPQNYVAMWNDSVPVFEIHARKEVRTMRLRIYPDVLGTGDPDTDPCAYCGDIVFSYIPPDTTLVFDGTDEVVYAIRGGGVKQRADSIVFGSDGGPFEWPQLTCGYSYIVALDLPQTQQPPSVDMSLYARIP